MRFKLLIKILVCIQLGFLVNLNFNASFAQESNTFEYWQHKTFENPMDAQAWFNLGVIYENGQGIALSKSKAKQSYSRSVELGYAPAMFNLGSLFAQQKDYLNAKLWWEKAAKKNVPEAQYNLATLYEKGWGVEQDPEKAAIWYQRAAETAMKKYLDLYQDSKEKLKEQSALSKTSISIFDHLSIVPLAVAATGDEPLVSHSQLTEENTNSIELSQAETDSQPLLSGWAWVYSQPEENFTIQLFATKEQAKTDKFIQQYALTQRAQVIPAIVKGTQYYKVILGNFTQWNDAAVEIGALPQDLRDQRPWVRTFASLHPEKPQGVDTEPQTPVEQPEIVEQPEQDDTQPARATITITRQPEQEEQVEQTESVGANEVEATVEEVAEDQATETEQEAESSQPQLANLDKQQAETEPRMAEKTSAESDPVDDVFTLYAKRQLESDGLLDNVKQQLQDGLQAIKGADHAKGYELLAPLAQAGLPEAQFRLSLLYAEGKGVGLDLNQAFEYAKLSAEQGHPYGQRLLAEFYSNGVGTKTNPGLATYWKQTAQDNIKKLEEN